MTEADLERCYYRSTGQNLTIDALVVEFEVEGETYTHYLPNAGWNCQTPALAFFGYVGLKPTDFDGDHFQFSDSTVPVTWNSNEGSYALQKKVTLLGSKKLQEAEWFNGEGEVWSGDGQGITPSIGPDPGTGNRAGVPVGEEKQNIKL